MPRTVHAGDPALTPSERLADLEELLRGLALDDDQSHVRDAMSAFASGHPDALVRACVDGHFTGSAFVVDHVGERALFLFHRKLQRWLQPGGHADGDGNLASVAWREATEETGIGDLSIDPVPIDLDIHAVEPPGEPTHLHLDVRFLVVVPPGAEPQGNHESEGLRWVDRKSVTAPDLALDPGTVRLARAGWARFDASAVD